MFSEPDCQGSANSASSNPGMGSMITKIRKYKLHYNEVPGDVLRPQHGTIPSYCTFVQFGESMCGLLFLSVK